MGKTVGFGWSRHLLLVSALVEGDVLTRLVLSEGVRLGTGLGGLILGSLLAFTGLGNTNGFC